MTTMTRDLDKDSLWMLLEGEVACNKHSKVVSEHNSGSLLVWWSVAAEEGTALMSDEDIANFEQIVGVKPECETCHVNRRLAAEAAEDTRIVAPAIGGLLVLSLREDGNTFKGLDYQAQRLTTGSYVISLTKDGIHKDVVFIQDDQVMFLHPEGVNIASEFIGSFNQAWYR